MYVREEFHIEFSSVLLRVEDVIIKYTENSEIYNLIKKLGEEKKILFFFCQQARQTLQDHIYSLDLGQYSLICYLTTRKNIFKMSPVGFAFTENLLFSKGVNEVKMAQQELVLVGALLDVSITP